MLNGNGIGNENMDNGILSEHYTPHTEEDESPEVSDRSSYRREHRSGYDARSARYQRSRRGGSSRQQGSSESQGSSFGLLGVQTVICALALLAAFLLSLSKSSVFDQSKVFIAQALSKSVTQQQITQAFDTIKKNLNSSDFFQLSTSSSSSNLGAVSSGSQSAASSKVSSSAASSSAAQDASSTAASVSNASSSGGKGGEDLDAVFSGSQLVPPKSASLGPLKLTVVPLWPVNGEITSGFGYRINPITKQLSFHTGMDIGANKDTPILAALSGTVEDVGKNEAYGNYILLLHGNGIETFYGHCDSVIKAKGDVVKAGEEIALVGTTGMSTGPHLHFEIRVGGVSYNPQWLLKS